MNQNGKAAVSTSCSDPCPKCGNAPNKLRWVDSGSDSSRVGPTRYWDEHLRHTCTCCGYGWNTKPLDLNNKVDAPSGAAAE